MKAVYRNTPYHHGTPSSVEGADFVRAHVWRRGRRAMVRREKLGSKHSHRSAVIQNIVVKTPKYLVKSPINFKRNLDNIITRHLIKIEMPLTMIINYRNMNVNYKFMLFLRKIVSNIRLFIAFLVTTPAEAFHGCAHRR